MFTCAKCKEPFAIERVEYKRKEIKLHVRCINGHKTTRKVDYQAQDTPGLFHGVYTCTECGSDMLIATRDMRKGRVLYTFICITDGPQEREVDTFFRDKVEGIKGEVEESVPYEKAMQCPTCEQEFSVHGIEEMRGYLKVKSICPNNHKFPRYLTKNPPEKIMTDALGRIMRCDVCGISGQLIDVEKRGNTTRITMNCAVHGECKKEIPVYLTDPFKKSIGIDEDVPKVHSILDCHSCGKPLAIRVIKSGKRGYKLKCRCANGHESEMELPLSWDTETSKGVAAGILRCRECGLFSPILEKDVGKKMVDITINCPIHGVQKKGMSIEVYKQIEDNIPQIELTSSIDRSMRCPKCHTPYLIKDSKIKGEWLELNVECRNKHGDNRKYVMDLSQDDLVQIYDHLFECPLCHAKQEFNGFDMEKDDRVVVLECVTHGIRTLKIPSSPEHESAIRSAYMRSVNLSKLEKIVKEKLQTQVIAEFALDEKTDLMEGLQLVMHVIGESNLQFVADKLVEDGEFEVWYYGMTPIDEEYVVIGSASKSKRMLGLRIATMAGSKIENITGVMKDSLREILLKRLPVADSKPIKIVCPHCMSPLSKRALPGEMIKCDACGTPIHWT
jgi:hypothetical protein